ncbi:ankyrin repeat-containing domain protein [Trichoderma evansii]
MAIDNMERPGQRGDDYPSERGCAVQVEITADFFKSIALGQENLVRDFIEQDSDITNTTNEHGETPLMAAIRADNSVIVRDLLWNGAKVDTLGFYSQEGQSGRTQRTPLQVAAAEGKLHMIRILRENRADVFFTAPDGVNALQLATSNDHESVVNHIRSAYTSIGNPLVASDDVTSTKTCLVSVEQDPARYARTHIEKSSQCITWASWAVPKFIIHKTPKAIITAISNVLGDKSPKNRLYRNTVESWCQEQIREFPTRIKQGVELAGRGIKEAAGLVTKTPETTWQLMKHAPNTMWKIMLYIGIGLLKLSEIAPYLVKQMTSIVQTIVKTVASIFQAITLHGIKSGFSAILRTVTKVLKDLSWLITGMRQTSGAILQTVVGSLKKVIIIFAALTLGICILFSKQTLGLLQAPRKLAKKGVQEILESMGPKKM